MFLPTVLLGRRGGGAAAWTPASLPGVTAYWPFDEVSSGNAVDVIDGATLTATGTVGRSAGVSGNAAGPFGSSNRMALLSSVSAIGGEFTVAFRVNFESVDSVSFTVGRNDFGSAGIDWDFTLQTGTLLFRVWGTGGPVSATGTITAGGWRSVIGWYDPDTDTVGIDIDGAVVTADATGLTPSVTAGVALAVGASASGTAPVAANTYFDDLLVATAVWTPTQRATYRLGTTTGKALTCDGNSLTSGVGATPGVSDYPTVLSGLIGGGWTLSNFGVSGQTTQAMSADAATQVDPTLRPAKNVLIAWEVTNDLFFGATAEGARDNFRAYCAARRATGWYVIVLPVLPREGSTGVPRDGVFESKRTTCNNDLADAANIGVYWDAYCPLPDLTDYDENLNTDKYPDGIHLNATWYAYVAAQLAPLVTAV